MLRMSAYTLTPIATTGDQFAGFAPYVPSIGPDGTIAFQASLRAGGSGLYAGRGGSVRAIVRSGDGVGEIVSHPDVNRRGDCCFYAGTARGNQGVFLVSNGRATELWPAAGPLGPTINESGAAAFRAPAPSGAGVYRVACGSVAVIAATGAEYVAFHGLPVIDERGCVLFRADLPGGRQAVMLAREDGLKTIAATGHEFSALGAFPALNGAGLAAFCASMRAGGSGVFVSDGVGARMVIDDRGAFESFRGAIVDSDGRAVLIATARGGSLGVFCGPDPTAHRVLGVGAPLLGSEVAEFALNPVSINGAGQLAVRVRLDDGREVILRGDPG
ncbi:MAG TPA: cell division protein FtsQ/DivIB [Phycisphaerales bacterium]|nr:cell division protein FtsQ/DivIB [Phycisphaerales bacterium]